LISPNVSADGSQSEKYTSKYLWTLSAYAGPHADDTLTDIVTLHATYSDGNYVSVVALAREVYQYKQWVSVEIEGQVGKHFETDFEHLEFVGLIIGRWHPFPWDRYIDTSFAIGSGLSYNSDVCHIESEEDEDAQRLLGYLAYELTFGLPQYPRWNLMFRIHHRSGAGNLIGKATTNYVCGGLKFAF
jgi:hypothetical protein